MADQQLSWTDPTNGEANAIEVLYSDDAGDPDTVLQNQGGPVQINTGVEQYTVLSADAPSGRKFAVRGVNTDVTPEVAGPISNIVTVPTITSDALRFDGAGDVYVDTSPPTYSVPNGDFSVFIIMQPLGGNVVLRFQDLTSEALLTIRIEEGPFGPVVGAVTAGINPGSASNQEIATGTDDRNSWALFAFERDGTDYNLYKVPINGTRTLASSEAIVTPDGMDIDEVSLGADWQSGGSAAAEANVDVYSWGFLSRTLTQSEMESLASGSDAQTLLSADLDHFVRCDSNGDPLDAAVGNISLTKNGDPQLVSGPF